MSIHLPDYVADVIKEASDVSLKLISQATRAADSENPILISVIKNEVRLLPDFLRHYRALGVERFVILDNGSDDGSVELLSSQSDVDCYAVHRRFRWPEKQGWINRVVSEYGHDEWYLYADADEHMVFSGSEEYSFRDLIGFAKALGVTRVRGMLIDTYADGPILSYDLKDGQSLKGAFPFFDSDSYVEDRYREIISRKGGPRPRRFTHGDGKFNPEMTKYPLFQLQPGELMANPHHIYPFEGNFDSPCVIGMLHYKFLPGFVEKIKRAIKDKTYWDGSSEYRRYLTALKREPDLSLMYSGTRRYQTSEDLVAAGLIERIDWSGLASDRNHLVFKKAYRYWAEAAKVSN